MIIPISINTGDFSQYSLSKEEIEGIVDLSIKEITALFAQKWEEEAVQSLHKTKQRYIDNLLVVDEGRMSGSIVLDYSKDPLVAMIEEGASAFDMKTFFEKSSKRHIKKDGTGWYLTIPFSAGTPGSIGETTKFSTIMPQEVYNIAKQGAPVSASSLKGLPDSISQPKIRAAVSAIPTSKTFEEYKNKSSIYQGIKKTTDSVTGQSSYNSFRRVSDNSDASAFIFSGINAYNLAEKTLSRFEPILETQLTSIIDNALRAYGIE